MPSVSVVIPSYNCAAYLSAAIESVLAQTWKDYEIIVIDDGSTDQTPEVVSPYLDRITYIQQINRGLPGARNTGIRAAKGEFIALLDADDAWSPEKLVLQMPLFADAAVGIVYSDFSVRYSDGRLLPSYLADRPLASEGWVVDNYIQSRFLFPSSMVIRRKALEEGGLFDEEMTAAEDIELFTRICLRWQVRGVKQPLMIRTEGTHNITANTTKMGEYTIRAFNKILTREPELPPNTRRTLHRELAKHLWWRGYAQFKAGRSAAARADLRRAVGLDRSYLRQCAPYLAASYLPAAWLRRLGSSTGAH